MTDNHYSESELSRDVRPSWLKGLVFLIILGLAGGGLILGAFAMRSQEGPKVASEAPEPLTVEVAKIEVATTFELEENYAGLATAARTSQLGFSGGGRIDAINVRVGDQVKAGETLAKLDTRALSAQLAASNAVVEEARAAYRLALDTVERQRTLLRQGHVSTQRVDEAEAQASTAAARIEAARAQADTLRVQIDLARITAPYDGVITGRFADEGAISGGGQPVLEIVEAGKLEARIGVPASAVSALEPGKEYLLQSESGPVPATLRSITGVVSASQRTVAAVFDFPKADSILPGSVVRLTLPRTIEEGGFWVPLKALTSASRGLWMVYVTVSAEGGPRAEARLVEMIYSTGDRAYVRGPMKPDDRVIVDGLHRITPGVPVTPVDSQRAAAGHDG